MNTRLCISIRFIQPYPLFHGRRDAEQPEWPPSPMRVFQALVNAAGLRARGNAIPPELCMALQTLEILRPEIIAPRANVSAVGYRAYVPHNQYDLVASALYRGMEPSTAAFRKLSGEVRTEKDFRPMRIESVGENLPAIHYIYPLDATTLNPDELLRTIRPSVRAITHFGWGIDQVVADVTLTSRDAPQFVGERWLPSAQAGRRLRVHRKGSLAALTRRHGQFVTRLSNGWTPVPPLTDDDVDQVRYRRDTDPLPRPNVVFKLVDNNDDPFRYPHAKLIHVAGMVRHLAIEAMDAENGNPPAWIDAADRAEWVERVVAGHRDKEAGDDHRQFSYVPLPSIGHAHADALIRNVMIVAPIGMDRELEHLANQLDGQALIAESNPNKCASESTPKPIRLERFTPPPRKFIAERYLATSNVWETVTPVILDGCNRKSKTDKPEAVARATEKLLCKAIARAGIEVPCQFTWQALPFMKNTLSTHKYDREGKPTGYFRPTYLQGRSAIHVRLQFDQPIVGPLTIGAGRHCGFGVFAAAEIG